MSDEWDFDIETMRPVLRDNPQPEPAAEPPKRRNLTTCHDCGGMVSRHAESCPHCGSQAFDAASTLGYLGQSMVSVGCGIIALVIVIIALSIILH